MYRDMIENEVLSRIALMIQQGSGVFLMTSEQLVREGICDPIKTFIKMEPHKISKLRDGKYRIISGVSVVDQIIDRLLFGPQNELEISQWDKTPSKPGIGLDDEGLRTMAEWFNNCLASGRKLLASDISGWDWSVQEWELYCDLRCREKLSNAEGSIWSHLARCRVFCISRKTFVLPDSSLISQRNPGIQASGWYNTSSTNSRMRVAARAAAYAIYCQRHGVQPDMDEVSVCVAMGDDCVEGALDGEVYQILCELGHTVKDIAEFDTLNGVEFCSHRWYADGLARPVNWVKTLFRFAQHPTDPVQLHDWIIQLQGDFRHLRGEGEEQIREVIADKLGSANNGN